MAEMSRNLVAVFLVLFIIISVVGTWSALTYLTSLELISPTIGLGPTQGMVTVNIPPAPMVSYSQGQVQVFVTS